MTSYCAMRAGRSCLERMQLYHGSQSGTHYLRAMFQLTCDSFKTNSMFPRVCVGEVANVNHLLNERHNIIVM